MQYKIEERQPKASNAILQHSGPQTFQVHDPFTPSMTPIPGAGAGSGVMAPGWGKGGEVNRDKGAEVGGGSGARPGPGTEPWLGAEAEGVRTGVELQPGHGGSLQLGPQQGKEPGEGLGVGAAGGWGQSGGGGWVVLPPCPPLLGGWPGHAVPPTLERFSVSPTMLEQGGPDSSLAVLGVTAVQIM